MNTLSTAIRDLLTDKDISLTAPASVNDLWLTPNDIRSWLTNDPTGTCQVQTVEEMHVNSYYPNCADVTAMIVVTTDSSAGEYLTQFTVTNQDLFNALVDAT